MDIGVQRDELRERERERASELGALVEWEDCFSCAEQVNEGTASEFFCMELNGISWIPRVNYK